MSDISKFLMTDPQTELTYTQDIAGLQDPRPEPLGYNTHIHIYTYPHIHTIYISYREAPIKLTHGATEENIGSQWTGQLSGEKGDEEVSKLWFFQCNGLLLLDFLLRYI